MENTVQYFKMRRRRRLFQFPKLFIVHLLLSNTGIDKMRIPSLVRLTVLV